MSTGWDTKMQVVPLSRLLKQLYSDVGKIEKIKPMGRLDILNCTSHNPLAAQRLKRWQKKYFAKSHTKIIHRSLNHLVREEAIAYFLTKKNTIVMPLRRELRSPCVYYRLLYHEMLHQTGPLLRPDWIRKYHHGYQRREEHVADLGAWYALWQSKAPVDLRLQQVLYLYHCGTLRSSKRHQQAIKETYRAIQYIAKTIGGR